MKFIKLTKKNIESIDCNEVAFYSYSEQGAMGYPGHIEIVTFDNKKYEGSYIDGELDIKDYFYALPSLNSQIMQKKKFFRSINLGMGNTLFVRNEIYDKYIVLLENEVPDYAKKPAELFKGWKEAADKLLNNFEKPEIKEIQPYNKELLNPFKCMGFDININDRETQKKIISFLERKADQNLDGYNYKCLNAYSYINKKEHIGIQFYGKRNNKDMTLTDKMGDLVIHHTGSVTWKCNLVTCHKENEEYFVKPHVKNGHGMAFIKFINTDTKPYLKTGTYITAQICCFAYDLRVFKGDERFTFNENNFSFTREDVPGPIYLSNNTIMPAQLFVSNEKNQLNLIRGDVIVTEEYTASFLGQKRTYKIAYIDTEFGVAPIIYSDGVTTYIKGDNLYPGDKIETMCSITGDLMLYYNDTKTIRDRFNYFDLLKRAFEFKNMDCLKGILSDDCEYHSDCHDYVGKEEVIKNLQDLTNRGYKDKDFKMEYCVIDENPIKNFRLKEEVLCIQYSDGSVEGELNFHMNKDKLIDRIYITNNDKIRFRIYRPDGFLNLTDEDKVVYKKYMDILEKKGFDKEQINTILNYTFDVANIAEAGIEYLKDKRKNDNLYDDLVKFELDLVDKYNKKHPHRNDIRGNSYNLEKMTEYKPRIVNPLDK